MTTTGKTSDYYVPCVMLWPDGRQRKANVAHIRMDSVESARQKLSKNQVAWVAPGDVEAVIASPVIQE
jgi:hypothetical protein